MSKTSSSSGETKQDDTPLHFLGSVLIPSVHRSDTTKYDFTETDIARWTLIFSFLHFNEFERLSVRSLCNFFRTVLPGPTCAGVYTIFPHPNHPSLNSLMHRLNDMALVEGINVEHLFLANGVHVIQDEYYEYYRENVNMVCINFPISIIGESREHCIVMGGLFINGKKEDDVNVSNLTLRTALDREATCVLRHGENAPENGSGDLNGEYGVFGYAGASIHLDNVSVENSAGIGVVVSASKRNTMKNCNVSHSKGSGLCVDCDGVMTISGKDSTIHHNCIGGRSHSHGLCTNDYEAVIHLTSSVTIETISTNNGGGGNYGRTSDHMMTGGEGTIAIVDSAGKIIETIY